MANDTKLKVDDTRSSIEQQLTFARSVVQPDGFVNLVVGVTRECFENMLKTGRTTTLDGAKIGMKMRLVVFAGNDHTHVMSQLEPFMPQGQPYIDARNKNFGIDEEVPKKSTGPGPGTSVVYSKE